MSNFKLDTVAVPLRSMPSFSIKSFVFALAAACLVSSAQAATVLNSYVVFQGEFDNVSGLDTYKFRLEYSSTATVTSQTFLNGLFGTPVQQVGPNPDFGDPGEPEFIPLDVYLAGNSNYGASYAFGGAFVTSFTIGGKTVTPASGASWLSYVSLGSYSSEWEGTPSSGTYDSNWNSSDSGFPDRYLADNSLDAWVVGSWPGGPPVGVDPNTSSFAGLNTVFTSWTSGGNTFTIYTTPEPSQASLVFLSLLVISFRRRRRSAC